MIFASQMVIAWIIFHINIYWGGRVTSQCSSAIQQDWNHLLLNCYNLRRVLKSQNCSLKVLLFLNKGTNLTVNRRNQAEWHSLVLSALTSFGLKKNLPVTFDCPSVNSYVPLRYSENQTCAMVMHLSTKLSATWFALELCI